MNWTQPICADCYQIIYPQCEPYVTKDYARERCCRCGKDTTDAIYVRIDPRAVKFPSEERE